MKVWKQKPLHFVEKELTDNLGEGNFIFVGSSTDMFAWDVKEEWISTVLQKCKDNPKNTYLFQSKNPARFKKFYGEFPEKTIFGTTIETNREFGGCPHSTEERYMVMKEVSENSGGEIMVTIEPIIDFDLDIFVEWIKEISPKWVNIGADSKGHNLPEPTKEKVLLLIEKLKKFTDVKIKDNLKRMNLL